jgi:hypothetical protein
MDAFKKKYDEDEAFRNNWKRMSLVAKVFVGQISDVVRDYRQQVSALQGRISQVEQEHKQKVSELQGRIDEYAKQEKQINTLQAENLIKAYARQELSEKPKLKLPVRAAMFRLFKEHYPNPLSPSQLARILAIKKDTCYYNIRSLELDGFIRAFDGDVGRKKDGRLRLYIFNKE